LGKGGFGEVWQCEAPGGLFKAIKFVAGHSGPLGEERVPAEEELRAVQHIKAIRHPFLLSLERVERIDGELVIVMELADKNLHDLLQEYRASRPPGIPREELLAYLREAAEALDLMNIRHGLQHLDIKPSNLLLVSNHVKIADFGLVNSLGGTDAASPPRQPPSAVTPLYASPEIFRGTFSAQSDQYSLAMVYQELLTGTVPFKGKNSRQLLVQHTCEQPDLEPLPEDDRPIVARALSKEPEQRFASCTELVQALSRVASARGECAGRVAREEKHLSSLTTRHEHSPLQETRRFPADGDVVPGFRFLECVDCNPLAESWKAMADDGRLRLVKFLYGFARRDAQQGEQAVARLRALQHPVLVSVDVVRHEPGRLVLVSDWFERSLWSRFQESQAQGLPGVPRRELLAYLRTAARFLDYFYQQHAIEHLALNPRNLLLDGDRPLIADFGLVQLLWLPAGQPVASFHLRYSAPEMLEKRPSSRCDQYSLALIYCDLLTGNTSLRQGKPNLEALPGHDRDIVARALDPDPSRRWPSCRDWVRALRQAAGESRSAQSSALLPVLRGVSPRQPQADPALRESADEVLTQLLASAERGTGTASGHASEAEDEQGAAAKEAGSPSEPTLFSSPLPLGSARIQLEALCRECDARVIRREEGELVFQIIRPRNFWQQCLGRQPGLEVQIRLTPPRAAPSPIEVRVQIASFGCGRKHGAQIVQEIGPVVLQSLRTCLQADAEQRTQERFIWHQPLTVRPVLPDGGLGEVIDCRGKDLSRNGIGFYLPRALPTTQVYVELPATGDAPSVTIPARIVRVQRCGDGWYDVGALFQRSEGQESGVRSQESGVRNQGSGIRNQESGVRSQESGGRE
jgi:serine/threonine protein kinase